MVGEKCNCDGGTQGLRIHGSYQTVDCGVCAGYLTPRRDWRPMAFTELKPGDWFVCPGIEDVLMQKVSDTQYYSSNVHQVLDLGNDFWGGDLLYAVKQVIIDLVHR